MAVEIAPELAERLSKSEKLPSPPTVALRLIELSRDPEVEFADLAETIAVDPALTAKIERTVHSPLYGLRQRAVSLRQALTLLGLRETLSLSLSYAIVGALRTIVGGSLDYEFFWQRSLLAATSARALAKRARRLDYEDIFLAALLQDLGMLAIDQALPGVYRDVAARQHDHDVLRMEEHMHLGVDHAQIGAWLMGVWDLPERLQQAVAASDNPDVIDLEQPDSVFERCVTVSGPLADVWLAGDWEGAYAHAVQLGGQLLQLSRTDLDLVVGTVGDQVAEIEALFDITLIAPEQLAKIAEEARHIGVAAPQALARDG